MQQAGLVLLVLLVGQVRMELMVKTQWCQGQQVVLVRRVQLDQLDRWGSELMV